MLAARGVLEIYRGKGTFVAEESRFAHPFGMDNLSQIRMNLKDLYEIRLMFEPQAAYYAAQRATSQEIDRILSFGAQEEALILSLIHISFKKSQTTDIHTNTCCHLAHFGVS